MLPVQDLALACMEGMTTTPGSGGQPGGTAGTQEVGQRSTAPARGPFPAGCKWRAVSYKGRKAEMWDVREYQYWDEQRGAWGPQQPAACVVRGQAKTDE